MITEIQGLDNLKKLKILELSDNEISEIKGLENLENLKELVLWRNPIKNVKDSDIPKGLIIHGIDKKE